MPEVPQRAEAPVQPAVPSQGSRRRDALQRLSQRARRLRDQAAATRHGRGRGLRQVPRRQAGAVRIRARAREDRRLRVVPHAARLCEPADAEDEQRRAALSRMPQPGSRRRRAGAAGASAQPERAVRQLHGLPRQDSRLAHKPRLLQMRSGVPRRNGTEARPESSERTDDMKSKFTRVPRATAWLALCLALSAAATRAQQPTPQPSPSQQKSAAAKTKSSAPKAGDDAGDYTVISSIELGVRGLRVGGDINKYQSDLNYKSGMRLFDTSFLLKAKEGKKGGLFDTLLVTSTGWGADPYGHVRISAENSKWYRFDGQYRDRKSTRLNSSHSQIS